MPETTRFGPEKALDNTGAGGVTWFGSWDGSCSQNGSGQSPVGAFALYVVVGSHLSRASFVDEINMILAGLELT